MVIRPQLAALSLLGGALAACLGLVVLTPQPSPQLKIGERVYPVRDETEIAAALRLRRSQLLQQSAYLSSTENTYEFSLAELGYDWETAPVARAAASQLAGMQAARSWSTRLLDKLKGRALQLRLEPQLTLDPAVASTRLSALSPSIDRDPIDAELRIAEHRIIASQSGRQLSVAASQVRLENAAALETPVVELYIETLAPRVTEEALAPVDVSKVLATYETSFRGKAGPRAINIRTAGRYLDGAILLPGEVLSFNEHVGRRIHGRGFVDAPVIVNDELEQDVGGGVCQVATTLHAAAVFGNVDVVQRRSHSRPSGYAPLGLDATVIDGKVDLKLRNPYDEPLLVHVSFPDTYTIRVELLGRDPEVKVQHGYSVTAREPYARRIWHRSEVTPGTFEKKQKGSEGMDVVSVLRIEHPDGKVEKRSYASKYYPVPEVFWMGEGATQSTLPPTAEGTAGVVVDGEATEGEAAATASQTQQVTDVPPLRPAAEEVL